VDSNFFFFFFVKTIAEIGILIFYTGELLFSRFARLVEREKFSAFRNSTRRSADNCAKGREEVELREIQSPKIEESQRNRGVHARSRARRTSAGASAV